MLLTILSYVPAVLLSWLIGLLTLLKNTHAKINIYFSLFTFSMGLWLAMLFLGDVSSNATLSLWAVRLATFFGTAMIAGVIFFATVFPVALHKTSKTFTAANVLTPLFFMILSLTPFLVGGIEYRENSVHPVDLGVWYTLQTIYAVGGFLLAAVLILKKYRRVDVRAKAQIRLVVYGLLLAVSINLLTGFILTVLNASNNYSNLVGSISFLVLVAFTAYTIVRHRLFDIRMAIVRTLGYIITILAAGSLFAVLIVLIIKPLVEDNSNFIFLLIPLTLLLALVYHPIQTYIANVTKRIFYQDSYNLRVVLDRFSDTLVANNEIDEIMKSSLTVISDAIKPERAYFVVFNEEGHVQGKIAHRMKAPKSTSVLVGDIKNMNVNPVARDALPEEEVPKSFMVDDVFLVLRLGMRDRPVGVMVFGPKQNGRTYTQQDADLLRIGAKNLTLALENAKKYQQISHFAEKLHSEVLRATSKLRHANKELKTLDALKDDFISMASHQLRTPASSVHEALQMLNHSPVPLNKSDKQRLIELAEASSEHLVTVVADMLSIARIQAGHFTATKVPVVMQEVVERVLRQTAILAEQKHIKLVFNKPDEPIHTEIDLAKINEAMSNYIENAIKYSGEKTKVTITLSRESNRLLFEVSDAGMGVPAEERKNLFGKFYRAANARSEQPDGNGIGLFVVKSIVEAHGGAAYYKPVTTGGSTFGFWLPL